MKSDTPAAIKDALLLRLQELARESASAGDSRRPVELDQQSVGRLSRMDALQVQAMAIATEERRNLERRRIDAALQRIADGSYGDCARCGEPIEAGRLRLDPTLPLCLACAKR